MNASISKRDILKLYRNCMIYVNSLKYSDKDYLRDRIRVEFRRDIEPDRLEYYYNKGLAFVQRDRLA